MKRISIIFIAKNFTQIDAYVPILTQLKTNYKKYKIFHDTLCFQKQPADEIKLSIFHKLILTKYGGVYYLFYLNKLKVIPVIILLIYRWIVCDKTIIIGEFSNYKTNRLYFFYKIFGHPIHFGGTQGVFNEKFSWRVKPEIIKVVIEEGLKKGYPLKEGHPEAFCYLNSEIELYNKYINRTTKYTPIGVPRLYSSWEKSKQYFGNELLNKELQSKGIDSESESIITIILTNPGPHHWFKKNADFFFLLESCISIIRSYFPTTPIFCKGKPHMSWITGDFECYPQLPNVHYTYQALAVLSLKTSFCVSIQESSGIFEFLHSQIPIIEYSQYSKYWRTTYPFETPWIDIPGFNRASNEKELKNLLSTIKSGQMKTPNKKEIAEYFSHKENLDIFLS